MRLLRPSVPWFLLRMLRRLQVLSVQTLLLQECRRRGSRSWRAVHVLPFLLIRSVPDRLPYLLYSGTLPLQVRLLDEQEGCAHEFAASGRLLRILRGSLRPFVLRRWSCFLHSRHGPGSLRVRSGGLLFHILRGKCWWWFRVLFLQVLYRSWSNPWILRRL